MDCPNLRAVLLAALATALAATTASATHPIAYSKTEVEAAATAADYPAYSATITAIGAPAEIVLKKESKTRPVTLRIDQVYAGRGMKLGDLVIRDYPDPLLKVDVAPQSVTLPANKINAGKREVAVMVPFLWFQCTPGVKARTLERLVRLAAVHDYESARPAVGILLVMRSSGVPVELPQLKPVVARQLMANYERFVATGNRRDPALEATLNRMAAAK